MDLNILVVLNYNKEIFSQMSRYEDLSDNKDLEQNNKTLMYLISNKNKNYNIIFNILKKVAGDPMLKGCHVSQNSKELKIENAILNGELEKIGAIKITGNFFIINKPITIFNIHITNKITYY